MKLEREERKKKRDAYIEIKAALTAIRDNTESNAIFDQSEVALEYLEEFEPQQWYGDEENEESAYKRQRGTQGYSKKAIVEEELAIQDYYGEKYGN